MESNNLNNAEHVTPVKTVPKIGKWEWDLETGVIYWSDELFRIFGFEPQSFVPSLERGLALIYPEDKEIIETAYRKAIANGDEYCIEKRIVKSNGDLAVVLSIGTVIKDEEGKIIMLLDIFQDITESKKITDKLKQTIEDLSERVKFIEKVIESMPFGVAINNINDGKVLLVNKCFSETYGWRQDDFTDIKTFFKKIYPDEAYRQEMSTGIINDIQSGDTERMQWGNMTITTSTGEKRVINAKNIRLFDQNLIMSTVTDVTQSAKQAEELYRVKTNQDALINGTADLIWSVDKDLRIITCNKAYQEVIKMVSGTEPLEGDFVMTKEFGEELNKRWENYYKRALNGERFEIKEQIFNQLVQCMQYALITFNPMFNETGELFGAACYSKDITDETNSLTALKKTKTELQTIMDSSLDMICSIDESGIIVSMSAACKTILGYTPDELTGKQLFDFLYPEDKEASEKIAAEVMKGINITNFENRYVHKDGPLVPLSWSARWDPDKRIRYGVARDATEKKKSDAALLESEKKYKYLFENNPLPILIWDFKSLQIVDCNQEALNKYGYTREEFLKLNIKQLRPEEDVPLLEDAVKTEGVYGDPHHRTWRHKKKNGEIMYMDVTGHLINYNGRKASLALSNDVTESQYYHELDKFEKNILELNVKSNSSLGELMMAYGSGIEALHPGMLCSIYEKRGNRLFNLASPSLPEPYLKAIEGLEIADNFGSCSTAAFLKQKVIVSDIANDDRWLGYKELADRFQLKSCWSYPIVDGKNNVLATFACYYHEIKTPSKQEENTIERVGHILQIILESHQREHALELSNERFEYVAKATSDIIWDWNLETHEVYYSDNMQKLLGHASGINGNNLPFYFEHVHPDDRERVVLYTDQVKYGTMVNWEQEYRFRKANGDYAFLMDKGIVIRDENGLGIRMVGAMHDITNRKEDEKKLLKSSQQLDLIYNNVKDAIFMLSVEYEKHFRFISINQAFVDSTGIEKAQIINKYAEDVIPEPSLSFILGKYREAVGSKTTVTWENTTTFTTGTKIGIVTVTPIYDPEGICTQLIGSVYDITERKQEEQQRQLLESVIKHASDAVLITEAEPFDEPGPRIVYVNNAFTQMTGYSADEVMGKSPRILQGAKSDKLELKRLKESMQKWQPCEATIINYKKNGDEFWIDFSLTPVADEKGWFTHWISIERDITERKKTEQALKAAYSEKNIILESIGDAFFAVDENWVVTYWNNHAERALQMAKEAILGHNLWEVFSGSINSESYKNYHLAIETDQVIHFEDYYAPLNAWHEISAYPSKNGLSVYFKDITERKLSDKKLKELNESLQKHAKELAISNAELEQFAYVASHDLQEPLRMVTSFMTQLELKYGNEVDERGKQYIHFAVDGAKRMRQIILDLLDFSRVGRLEDELEDVNFNKLINDILALYRRQIEELQAEVTFENLPVIQSYKTPLRQVFQNLIGNGLKYHNKDVRPEITISFKETKKEFQFSVKDNGIGISSEYFDKIFIIFQRLHNKDEYSGTGMGLAISKKIVENLGGKIWVESAEGKGSTFYFTILKNEKVINS